jgi:enoyl-CoA hydratase/carnithine racemase
MKYLPNKEFTMSKTPARKKKTAAKKNKTEKKPELVIAEELNTSASGYRLGIMTLNSAKTMNAVDLEMVNLIDEILARWQDDDQIVAVIMKGAGEKAFCAGGDIRQLYTSMMAQGDDHLVYADNFFKGEYSKNYRVHKFGKPLIAWGHGFVMGGGLGLFIGANHRVGTETLKLAWPEIRIGLFPDVAGSYYLSRLPFPIGHWMALTGSQMNARDCKSVGLINYCLQNEDLDSLITALLQQPWQKNKAMNNQYVRELLHSLEPQLDQLKANEETGHEAAKKESQSNFPESQLEKNLDQIKALFSSFQRQQGNGFSDNQQLLEDFAIKLQQFDLEDPWLLQGRDNFLSGCPATAHIIMQQLQLGRDMTLKEVVMFELVLALQSVRHPDFAEGIRAMVVDKDFQPAWQHGSLGEVSEAWLKGLMTPLWSLEEHPFQQL